MDFQKITAEAKQWTANDSKQNFRLQNVNETERKLIFVNVQATPPFTFFVEVGLGDGEHKWHVWSDNDQVLSYIAEVQDFLESKRAKSLADILNYVCSKLSPLCKSTKSDEVDDEDDDMDEDDDDDDAIEDGYYDNVDEDALDDNDTEMIAANVENTSDEQDLYMSATVGSPTAVSRLLKDMKNLKQSNGKYGVTGNPRGDNLFIWDVELTDFDSKSLLGKDLQQFAVKFKRNPHIYLEMKFPQDFPMAPPFVRVIRPRFKFLTGHVTIGGSICMEMLTRSGWRPTNDIEGILVQVRCEIMSDPNVRLDSSPDRPYDEAEAKQAFDRMVQRYGWNM